MKIGISIVEFNTSTLLEKCLTSIFEQKTKHEIEIWVVDNNSEDNSVEIVKNDFPKVHLAENKENLGFAKGHNVALKKIKTNYTLILNSDTEIGAGTIDGMVEFMQKNDCGLASCKIMDYQNNLQPNGGDLPFGLALISWLFNLEIFGNLPNFHRNEGSYYKKVHEVGWVSGSFMMVKNVVFDKIGYFNEDYFMYFEDIEFCYKAKKMGFKVMINPDVMIKHVGGASSTDPHLRQWKGEMEGLIYFYGKQFGQISAVLVKMLVLMSTFLRMIIFGLMGNLKFAKTYKKILKTSFER